jgi:hypothetical protein
MKYSAAIWTKYLSHTSKMRYSSATLFDSTHFRDWENHENFSKESGVHDRGSKWGLPEHEAELTSVALPLSEWKASKCRDVSSELRNRSR